MVIITQNYIQQYRTVVHYLFKPYALALIYIIRKCVLVLLIAILPIAVLAATWPSYPPPFPGNYEFLPKVPDNSRDTEHKPPPLIYSDRYSYTQTRQYSSEPPQLEVEILNNHPYVQENLIVLLRVISGTNIEQMNPILPTTPAVAFQKLLEPTASNQLSATGQLQIVNEMRYMLTPLRPGKIELDIGVTIALPAGNISQDTRLTLQAPQALHLEVRPQVPGIKSWLPLEQLAISSNLDTLPEVSPGEPVALVIKLSAAGILGNQLPSLEAMLQSPNYRVYRGKTEWEGGPSRDGHHVMGTRTEYFTLVPQASGTLKLPVLNIPWFNVHTDSIAYATLTVNNGANLTDGNTPHSFTILGLWWPWYGALMLLMLIIGYWLGTRNQQEFWELPQFLEILRITMPKLGLKFTFPTSIANGVIWLRTTARRLNSFPYYNHMLHSMAQLLPIGVRFWWWVRIANTESSPELWRHKLQLLSWQALAIAPYATWSNMLVNIMSFQPASKREPLRNLLKMLDSATYGNQSIDFNQWKHEFTQQIRPSLSVGLFGFIINTRKHALQYLLPLNPE